MYQTPFYLSMRILADTIGIALDDVRYRREEAVTDRTLSIAAGTIEAGTVAAMRILFEGIVHGRPGITFEWVWRVTDDVAPEWHSGGFRWLLHIDGDPTLHSEISLSTTEDAGRATSLAAAAVLLNAVPTVCSAPPGILDNLTLPTYAGGYFAA